MELRQLRAFAAVARERSFTRAARALRVAQPALSQQLRALEVELGVVLIERSNRTGGLTDAGTSLLPRAERILAEVDDAGAEMAAHAGLRRGTVRLGCALQTLIEGRLASVLAGFYASHPGIRIALHEIHTEQVFHLLGRGKVDLGLVHLGRAGAGAPVGAENISEDLALAQLYREPLVLIVGPGHRLAGRAAAPLEEARDEAFVTFRPGATVRRVLALAARQRGFVPRVAFTSANMGTVRALVSAGLGVALVPRSAVNSPSPPLHAVVVSAPRLERIVTLARNKSRYERPSVAAVRRLLSDELRART